MIRYEKMGGGGKNNSHSHCVILPTENTLLGKYKLGLQKKKKKNQKRNIFFFFFHIANREFFFNPLRTGVKPGFLTFFEKRANGEKG